MATRFPVRAPEADRGFSLAECLLAVALFSLGLLGAGALVGERLRESRAAHSYFLAEMHGQDLGARIAANPTAAGGAEFRSWLDQAGRALPGLQCDVTAMGGDPPAHRVEMRWPLAGEETGRAVLWIGR